MFESSNDKSVRITVVNKLGVVIGDSHKSPSEMDNHLNRPEIKESLDKGFGLANRYSNTLKQELIYYLLLNKLGDNIWIVRVSIPPNNTR